MTNPVQTAARAIAELKKYQEPERIPVLSSFFKTGKGQYGEGDKFIGVTVPNVRIVAKKFINLPLSEIEKLLMNKVHECRSLAVYILDARCAVLEKQLNKSGYKVIFDFYLAHSRYVNNWDLVDVSARDVVGGYLFHHQTMTNTMKVLIRLAKSNSSPHALWERRIAMIATLYFINKGEFEPTLTIARILLKDKHDLMHKAVGWMLREMGKKDPESLHTFLKAHSKEMPRTALRYAIERMTPAERVGYMAR